MAQNDLIPYTAMPSGATSYGLTTYPTIVANTGSNVYVQPTQGLWTPGETAAKEPEPLDWLLDQVDEVRQLARAA